MRGKGGLVSSARTSSLFFVLSFLWYCVCNVEGQSGLESNEHQVCLGAVGWLIWPQIGCTLVRVVILWVEVVNIECKDRQYLGTVRHYRGLRWIGEEDR